MKRFLLSTLSVLFSLVVFGQTVTGVVLDASNGDPLIGASVTVVGTGTGTTTDIDGTFSIAAGDATQVEITYLGYQTLLLTIPSDGALGNISLNESGIGLEEVVVTGTMDIVRDRRTPVAVSTISIEEIQANAGNVEFPELMKNTPSIYVANQSGGYGDSEVFTRGFDQTNTAFLLNGQPINGMEDGKMYWSNWSGMTDVATAVQVQRGLGSSKLAISSVGGTTNIVMKATEQRAGGNVSFLYGNDNYMKATMSYNTGMMNDKFGVSMLLTHWQGDGWADGTQGQGQNYFLSAGYKVNEKNSLNFLLTGAPQWHDQNFSKNLSNYFGSDGELNVKYNNNYGYRNGEYFTLRRNFYHKPVANLNWDYKISDKSKFSVVGYASWGRGGGTGDRGNRANRFFTDEGYYDWDKTIQANQDSMGRAAYIVRASVNNHSWYGAVANYETQINDNVTWSAGADLRTYRGSHFRQVVDLMGAPYFSQRGTARYPDGRQVTATFEANPWSAISKYASNEEHINYNNEETIKYGGVFSQLEYSNEKLSAFVQGAVSNQAHVRFEMRNETEANQESEKVTNLGYNLKTGLSYSINANNIVFFNTGYYQRQPFHDNIYLNFSNTVNPVTVPEKIFGLEAGYKLSFENFSADINLYRTSWKDRAATRTLREGDELPNGTVVSGEWFRNTLQSQLHQGVEFDFGYKVNDNLKLKGYASLGDWTYDGSLNSKFYNEERELVYEDAGEDADGVKVGGAAQTSFGLGLDYKMDNGLSLGADYNFYDGLHSRIGAGTSSLELPSYGLLDLGASYMVDMGNDQYLTLRANVYNALGKVYISQSRSAIAADTDEANNWNGVNKANRVQFGKTTTWNVSARYSF